MKGGPRIPARLTPRQPFVARGGLVRTPSGFSFSGFPLSRGCMARVVLEDLVKIYPQKNGPDVRAVNGIGLSVADGEFMVLVGPSGCGKSTTLRMIAGLEEPSGGRISIDDRVVNGVAPKTGTSRWSSRTMRCTRT